MGDKAPSRIVTLVWPFDLVLRALRFWVPVVMAAAAASLTVFLRPKHTALPLAVAVVVAGVVIGVQQYRHHSDRLVASLYRRHALAVIDGVDGGAGHRFARLVTSWALKAPRFEYGAQRELLGELVAACRSGVSGQLWFVEGDSGSGKTRTALLLAQTLLSDELLSVRSQQHCLLYDLASEESQRKLVERLGSGAHARRVIIIDNFHLADARTLRETSRILLGRSSPLPELIIIVLARPRGFWSTNPEEDVAIVEAAKEHQRFARLNGPILEHVARRLRALNPALDGIVRTLGFEGQDRATGVQLHIAQAFARRRSVESVVADVANAVLAEPAHSPPRDLAAALGIATGLAVHRGTFTRSEFRRAATRFASGRHAADVSARELRRMLRSMRRAGLILSPQAGTRLVFHDALAELCVDRLWDDVVFGPAFSEVVRIRMSNASESDTGRWLLATELNDSDLMKTGFDSAASAGSYGRMAHCVGRLAARGVQLGAEARIQHAVLLDRVGKFSESRLEFATVDRAELGNLAPYSTMLLASRIEVNHGGTAEDDAQLLATSEDQVIADIGRYWQLHMAAHHGTFAPQPLYEIAKRLNNARIGNAEHWLRHATLRAYTDSFRHLYLSGGAGDDLLEYPQRWRVFSELRQDLAVAEAFETLYTKAHLIAHVLLPHTAIYGGVVAERPRLALGLGDSEDVDAESLIVAARLEYQRARRQFAQYGDREAHYLKIDELNMEMIANGADLAALQHRLDAYQEFITQAGFEDLMSYPLLYRWRWHMLSYFGVLLGQSGTPSMAAPHLRRALVCLEQATTLDEGVGNAYGVFRADLLARITAWLDPRGAATVATATPKWCEERRQEAQERGYGIESSLLLWLASNGPLSPEELRTVVRFYPIVHQ